MVAYKAKPVTTHKGGKSKDSQIINRNDIK
jgi:hypothetical protein